MAAQTHAADLDLQRLALTTLPPVVESLIYLEELYLQGNLLQELPLCLSHLRELRELHAYQNKLTALPPWISNLSNLQRLDVSRNHLTALPEELGHVASLRILDLSGNDIQQLPRSIEQLQQLADLDIAGNSLLVVTEAIGKLVRLRLLNLSRNHLSALPTSLGDLAELRRLRFAGNRIASLPDSLGRLPHLEEVDASDNDLRELPSSLRNIASLNLLDVRGNDRLGLPTEIVRPSSPATMLEYYFRARRGGQPLNEAKLILVGRGGVGKTCLIKRLTLNTFDEYEPETPGIEIKPWSLRVDDGDMVRLHVWDFGGQEILHATHQFFLTERTLYLLVLSGREGQPMQDAEYWLQLIRSFGGTSRVIIVLNKSSQHPFDINRGLLLEKYPFIADIVRTDCQDASGISELLSIIRRRTDQLEHRKVSFPAEWFAIKERLSGMTENFISWDQYQGICRSLGETDVTAQRSLAGYLHDLGIAFNYADDPRLHDTRVLKPRWVTEGIYAILRLTTVHDRRGLLEPSDLTPALNPRYYRPDKHEFLLRLMERFQLCFRLPDKPERYLVPELLGENQPFEIKAILDGAGLGFRYQYEVLPEGLLPRFIVQTHAYSEANPQWRWRTGVVLERDGCRAVVRTDPRERRVDIHIAGAIDVRRREFLAVIRDKFEEQHRDLKGLAVDERVPLPGGSGATVSYRDLLKREERGERQFFPENHERACNVADLLNGLESAENRARRRAQRNETTAHAPPPAPKVERQLCRKTIVEVDLKGYSDTARELEEHFSAITVLQLNDQIQDLVDEGLRSARVRREQTVMAPTGDGAILGFDEIAVAHTVAVTIHEACQRHNATRTVPSAMRWFRIGIATGELATETQNGVRKIGGTVIARAVRLEAAARPGEIVIDHETYAGMSARMRECYGVEETVTGKREERFPVHRYAVVEV